MSDQQKPEGAVDATLIHTIKLPSGQVITIRDWVDTELRASFDLVGHGMETRWEPFDTSRAMPMSESGRTATLVDTSMPMRSYLPRDWEALVFGWRATLEGSPDLLESKQLAAWAASTSCSLHYRDKGYTSTTLTELLKAQRIEGKEGIADAGQWIHDMVAGTNSIPLHIHCLLHFGVTVSAESQEALSKLRARLRAHSERLDVRFFLRCWLARPVV